jgi:8-oxo-dGTP pyrophosphatase MutT (NUDIX family)
MKQKILSAGAVIVHRTPLQCRYLLLRCFRYWDFPKGIVEAGEAPLSAARREVEEETALSALDFLWGTAFLETLPYGPGKVARYYLASTPTDKVELPVNPELGRPEHDEFRWLLYRDARALLSPRLVPVLDWAHGLSAC